MLPVSHSACIMTNHDKRKILLAVTGLSPQIVTETLYALAVGQETPWVPDDIQLITRCEGAERAWLPPTRHRELPGGQHQPVITQAPHAGGVFTCGCSQAMSGRVALTRPARPPSAIAVGVGIFNK